MNIRHIIAISSKFLIAFCLCLATLTPFFGVSIINALWVSILITAIGYPIGDLYVLKKLGNFFATAIDFGFVFIVLWLFAEPIVDTPYNRLLGAGIASLVIAVSEFVYHMFIEITNPLHPSKADIKGHGYAVEVGEEFAPAGDKLINESDEDK
ncbi:DUF2512 family protein [Pseudalkalibacillus berkeleyi]|uniref:YndM family protein n=1 Tax=Pseudalkalibacillus berkeleyi TaxID=1069813 RepID=A0ABS9H4E4_9BACL|nr:DUF2512 family protein [Pseudalkalibacillus berkeleyi]MCF6138809.1 YndM family protein [Pseudalkalibacillus berkeleyi]